MWHLEHEEDTKPMWCVYDSMWTYKARVEELSTSINVKVAYFVIFLDLAMQLLSFGCDGFPSWIAKQKLYVCPFSSFIPCRTKYEESEKAHRTSII